MAEIDRLQPAHRIRILSDQASSVRVDLQIPAKRYYRSSLEMVRMAKVYYSEGNMESAFVLYQKYLCLMLEQLPKHPEYSTVDPFLKKTATRQCKEAINAAEEIKQKLQALYEAHYTDRLHAESLRLQKLKLEAEKQAEENRRIQEEARAREAAEDELKKKQALEAEDRKFAMYLEQELKKESNKAPPVPVYPVEPSAPPLQPPSNAMYPNDGAYSKPELFPINPPSYGEATSEPPPMNKPVPSVDRSTKPGVHFTHTDSDLTNHHINGLKPVTVPISIPQRFTQLAKDNTLKNVETCGLLFGKLERNAFHITHVVIPKQKGAPDSCTMLNEEEIFQFHDEHELIQLGWIHTHPTQTAFLSSVDLHTQVGYQIMMPEAIAIVVAPKFNEVGVYHLTPEHGLEFISKCASQGFHPHPKEPALFQTCEHVKMDPSHQPVFVDLR